MPVIHVKVISYQDPRADPNLGRHTPCADTPQSGRYASYWNVFLLPPANKFAKVMFLHLSVSHSVHSGSTWTGTPPGRYTSLGKYTPDRYTPWQVHPPDRYTPQTGTPPSRYTPRQVHPPGRYTSLDRYTPPGSSACWEIRATSGWYASYWNAFLSLNYFHSH